MPKNDGGPAFPFALESVATAKGSEQSYEPGMSLRDYFAAAALPSVIAAYVEANGRCIGTDHFVRNVPVHAYRMADAMLAERSKE